MAKAKYELLEDGTYFGTVPGFRGVWGSARNRSACRRELQEVLEDWLVVSLQLGNRIPRLPGVRPFPKKMRIAG